VPATGACKATAPALPAFTPTLPTLARPLPPLPPNLPHASATAGTKNEDTDCLIEDLNSMTCMSRRQGYVCGCLRIGVVTQWVPSQCPTGYRDSRVYCRIQQAKANRVRGAGNRQRWAGGAGGVTSQCAEQWPCS